MKRLALVLLFISFITLCFGRDKTNTSAFPNIPRSEWLVDWITQPIYLPDGLLYFEYAIYASQESKDNGEKPFLLNSHKAMVRENHQRIKTDIDGNFLHISGTAVAFFNIDNFLKTSPLAYCWVDTSKNEWKDNKNRTLTAFVFKTYWGVDETLDPQWQRETFIVPQAQQVQELLDSYLKSVEIRRLSGDRRGTTLDLQVGAGADDSEWGDSDNGPSGDFWTTTVTISYIGFLTFNNRRMEHGYRFTNVTITQGSTIDVAYLTFTAQNTTSGNTVNTRLKAEDADNTTTFGTQANFEGRARTSTFADWDALSAWTNNIAYNSVSSINPIQTVINRAGWVSGNALVIFDRENVSTQGVSRTYHTYDSNTSKAPKLHIEYTVVARRIIMFD